MEKTIGKYQLIEKLGQGGLAVAYKAYDASTNKYVVMSVMRKELSCDRDYRERFIHKSKTLSKMVHPHILRTEYGEENDLVYSVMENINDITNLRDRISNGPKLSLDKINKILNQIASALDCAHMNGIMHCDVKPMNILIDENDNAFLVDFGCAKITHDKLNNKTQNNPAQPFGSPDYMSPEQFDHTSSITTATDIYSFAIIAYEMLTGKLPHTSDNLSAMALKKFNDSIESPSKLQPEIPKAIDDVIRKALSNDPEKRYQTAGAMAADFAKYIGNATKKDTVQNNNNRKSIHNKSPWISGSFYLFATVILMTLLAVISENISWYALAAVFIGGLLAVAIIGALQLRNDDSLSEKNFLSLVVETFKRMPILRGGGSV